MAKRRFKVTIKERCGSVLHPEYCGDEHTTRQSIIKFFGLDQPDVEDWSIEEVK